MLRAVKSELTYSEPNRDFKGCLRSGIASYTTPVRFQGWAGIWTQASWVLVCHSIHCTILVIPVPWIGFIILEVQVLYDGESMEDRYEILVLVCLDLPISQNARCYGNKYIEMPVLTQMEQPSKKMCTLFLH